MFETIKKALLESKVREMGKKMEESRARERDVLREWRKEKGNGGWEEDGDGDGDVGEGKKGEAYKITMADRAMATGMAGAISGVIAAVVTTPIDVVKTRIMLAAGQDPSDIFAGRGGEAEKVWRENQMRLDRKKGLRVLAAEKALRKTRSSGALAVGRQVWAEEGIKGLFRGGSLRGAWTALGSGLYLSVYESGRQYLEERRKGEDD